MAEEVDNIGGSGVYDIPLGGSLGSIWDSYSSCGCIDGIFSQTGSGCLVSGSALDSGSFFWYLVPFIAALLVAFSMDSVTTFVQLAVILGLTNVAGLEVALVG